MSKKVLIISSSPREGGNSDTLCDEFLKGAVSKKHDVQKVFLKNEEINYCTGCGYCNTIHQTGCSQIDDMVKILDLMIEADVIVLATPVYFYTMCGQLKTFIDRCCARYTKINNKEFYFIISAAHNQKASFNKVSEELRSFLSCLNGAREKGSIFAFGVWQIDDVKQTNYPKQAFELGASV